MASKKKTNGRAVIPPGLRAAFGALDALSPALAARLAEPLFLRTRRYPVPAREVAVLQGAERHALATSRGPAVAWVWGRPAPAARPAPTAFLVHGWEGRGSQLGAFVEPLRRAGFRVVAIDAPGHGEAPGRSSSLPAIAAALEAAAERWKPPAALVAHSAGAVAATFALARGLAVERAVFVAAGADLLGYTAWFAALLGLGERARRRLAERIERRIGVPYAALEPLERAPEMTAPLLAFSDRDDPEAPLATAERLVRSWPGAELRVTESLGHRRILWDPAVVRTAVSFLAEASGESLGAAPPEERVGGRPPEENAELESPGDSLPRPHAGAAR
jgi:pimeloyl-ACP methyl ester carboxylesterase